METHTQLRCSPTCSDHKSVLQCALPTIPCVALACACSVQLQLSHVSDKPVCHYTGTEIPLSDKQKSSGSWVLITEEGGKQNWNETPFLSFLDVPHCDVYLTVIVDAKVVAEGECGVEYEGQHLEKALAYCPWISLTSEAPTLCPWYLGIQYVRDEDHRRWNALVNAVLQNRVQIFLSTLIFTHILQSLYHPHNITHTLSSLHLIYITLLHFLYFSLQFKILEASLDHNI